MTSGQLQLFLCSMISHLCKTALFKKTKPRKHQLKALSNDYLSRCLMLNTWVLNNHKLLSFQTINCQNNLFTAWEPEKNGFPLGCRLFRGESEGDMLPYLFGCLFISLLKACPSALLDKQGCKWDVGAENCDLSVAFWEVPGWPWGCYRGW